VEASKAQSSRGLPTGFLGRAWLTLNSWDVAENEACKNGWDLPMHYPATLNNNVTRGFSALTHIPNFAPQSTISHPITITKAFKHGMALHQTPLAEAGRRRRVPKSAFQRAFAAWGGLKCHVVRKSFPDGGDWYYFSPGTSEQLQGFIAAWDGIPVQEPTDLHCGEKII
jgi:hypothetical protein